VTSKPKQRDYAFQENATMDAAMVGRTASLEAAFLLPFLSPAMSLVDAGCGQGTISVGLAKVLPEGRVLGFDTQEAHIARARALAESEGVSNASFEVADLYQASYPDESYDVAYANAVLSHQADPEGGLAAMTRLVKPGGLVAIRDRGGKRVESGSGRAAMRRATEILEATIDLTSRNPHGSQAMGEMLNRLCREAGLSVLQISASWEVHTARELAATRNPHPLAGPLSQRAIQAGITTETELKQVLETVKSEWMSDQDAYFAVPWFEVVARKP
jgi:ubiquinone/menaquinone biosynthesis C-methylase UbiE